MKERGSHKTGYLSENGVRLDRKKKRNAGGEFFLTRGKTKKEKHEMSTKSSIGKKRRS